MKAEPALEGTTRIQAFIEYLVDNGYITSDEWGSNVFFGSEIWVGSGETDVDDYSGETDLE